LSSKTVRDWFDRLEEVLAAEAQLAGLLGQGTMIGDAREFLVSKMLRSFLPASVQVGRGKIIDSEERVSNQIDVIVYDPRFPMLRTEGGGSLYFVEGVIRAIEVKSTINREKLIEALDNCHSVMALSPHGADIADMDAFAAMLRREQDLTPEQSAQAAPEQVRPKTYVFGFRSTLSQETTTDIINGWYKDRGEPVSQFQVRLPRIITTGNVVAIADDVWMRMEWDENTLADLRSKFGPDARIVMRVYESKRQFGWLALHLMDHAASRLGCRDFHTGVSLSLAGYQPAKLYHSELKDPRCIVWTGKTDRSEN
jgi:hypothetical protein